MPESLAVVLPRYGSGLGGGAETLMRALALALADAQSGAPRVEKIEIWTTCAVDHRTWENELPAGETVEDGLPVTRFPVDERNLETFIRHELAMQDGRKLNREEQLEWLAASVNSRELYEHIARNGRSFDAILFGPYLFATSFWGALIHPERSLLLPCLHNEHYAYLDVFQHLFRSVRGLVFNAEPEQRLAAELYRLHDIAARSGVVGMGFSELIDTNVANGTLSNEVQDVLSRPFLLYSGRKEQGKNLHVLLDQFTQARGEHGESFGELVLIGAGEVAFCDELPPGVRDLGFVSEEEKHALMRGATALCQPSTNESFSIVMMEAWQHQTPCIVHGECSVTRDHVVRSGGGLYASTAAEFQAVAKLLRDDSELATRMGQAGQEYVRTTYSWEAVLSRFTELMEKLNGRAAPTVDAQEELT